MKMCWRKLNLTWTVIYYYRRQPYFYAPGMKGPPGASSNRIVFPSVCLCSVPLTKKVQYVKLWRWYRNQTLTVSSSMGLSHLTDITCPWGGTGSNCRTWIFFHILTLLSPGAAVFHKHMFSFYRTVIGKRFLPMGHFQLFSMILKFSMGHFLSFLVILHRLWWAIFQVNGTMAHGPLPSQSLYRTFIQYRVLARCMSWLILFAWASSSCKEPKRELQSKIEKVPMDFPSE